MNYTVKKPWHAWSVPGEEGAYVGGYAIQYVSFDASHPAQQKKPRPQNTNPN